MSNRIDGHCWWKKIDFKAGVNGWRQGILRAWSTDHEEYESGPGHFPVGVVEDVETKRVHPVPVHLISFSEDAPQD